MVEIATESPIGADFRSPRDPNVPVSGKLSERNATLVSWTETDRRYRCKVRCLDEEDGSVSVSVPTLPGVASFGDTESEAIENIREALAAAIESYLADGEIPWISEAPPAEPTESERWVSVDV